MTVEEFRADVNKWLATAKHPRWNRPYTELVYQPSWRRTPACQRLQDLHCDWRQLGLCTRVLR